MTDSIQIIAIGMPGGTELIVILLIVVMVFGLGKLPKAAKQLGLGVRNFQKSVKGEDDDDDDVSEPKILEDVSATASRSQERTKERASS